MHQTIQPDQHLDLSGLHCPIPLIRCLATLHQLPAGAQLHVTLSNPDALNDIALVLRRGPHQLAGWQQDADGRCHFVIRKKATARPRIQATPAWLQLLLRRFGMMRPPNLVVAG